MRRRWVALLLIAMVNSPAAEKETFACVLLGKASARVQVKGVLESPPLRLSDCSGITPATDGVTMCYVGPDGRRTCSELPASMTVKPPGDTGRGTATRMAPTVMLLLRGDVQTRPGLTRATGAIQGFPSGTVFLEGAELAFPLAQDARVSDATKLTLRFAGSQGAPGYPAVRKADAFVVPNELLTRGAAYVWTVESPAGRFSGRFAVAGDDFEHLAIALRAIDADAKQSPTAKAYLKAELFEEYGMPFNRDLELARVRSLLSSH